MVCCGVIELESFSCPFSLVVRCAYSTHSAQTNQHISELYLIHISAFCIEHYFVIMVMCGTCEPYREYMNMCYKCWRMYMNGFISVCVYVCVFLWLRILWKGFEEKTPLGCAPSPSSMSRLASVCVCIQSPWHLLRTVKPTKGVNMRGSWMPERAFNKNKMDAWIKLRKYMSSIACWGHWNV